MTPVVAAVRKLIEDAHHYPRDHAYQPDEEDFIAAVIDNLDREAMAKVLCRMDCDDNDDTASVRACDIRPCPGTYYRPRVDAALAAVRPAGG